MNFLKNLSLAAVAAASIAAMPAEAVTLKFTLTGDYSATWNIMQNPSPDGVDLGLGFSIYDVQGTFPGTEFGYVADIDFINAAFDGGFAIFEPTYAVDAGANIIALSGAQLYTGSEASPTFLLGTFVLRDFFTGLGTYSLKIEECQVCTAVPEPNTWAMMLVGFGAVGGALRSRRRLAGAVKKVTVSFS